jgi:acetyl-CoA carboxylase biotin carboxyl carrier protein
VNIETEELKLSVVREAKVKTQSAPVQMQAPVVQAAPIVASSPTPASAAPVATAADDTSNYLEVKSPMIGTFYRSTNPESPAFASVGDKIETGQTVCIVEAMKLFNEIESEVSGTIVKVMVENASPVEYDQVLFLVDPS